MSSTQPKIVWIFVVYRSHSSMDQLLRAQTFPLPDGMTLVIVDNSDAGTHATHHRWWKSQYGAEVISAPHNPGYFGGAREAMKALPELIASADFVAVSNVDLNVSLIEAQQALAVALARDAGRMVGAYAPRLVDAKGRTARQLHYFERPSVAKYSRLADLYSNYPVAAAHRSLRELKQRFVRPQQFSVEPIFAPHGALMVFTRAYIAHTAGFDHPAFLFAEEVFVGCECEAHGLACLPLLDFTYSHRGHGSMGSIPSRWVISRLREAHLAVLPQLQALEGRVAPQAVAAPAAEQA